MSTRSIHNIALGRKTTSLVKRYGASFYLKNVLSLIAPKALTRTEGTGFLMHADQSWFTKYVFTEGTVFPNME